MFQSTHLSKQSRPSKAIADFFFPSFPSDRKICPVTSLRDYKERTVSYRKYQSNSYLFHSFIGKHSPVSSSTIARWLRTCLSEAGIDTNTFKAHSVRGAACSSAAWTGVSVSDILNAVDWSSTGTFQTFYKRETTDRTSFGCNACRLLGIT